MDTNFVLAGKHEGCVIKTDNENKVFIEYEMKLTLSSNISRLYFDKTNVVSIEKVNEEASSFKTSASYWLGSVAAAGMSDVKDIILKITWRDNTESMIKVREGIYTQILATRMSDVSAAFHLKTEEERKKWEEEHKEQIKRADELVKEAVNNPTPTTMSPTEKKNVMSGCLAVLVLVGIAIGLFVLISKVF